MAGIAVPDPSRSIRRKEKEHNDPTVQTEKRFFSPGDYEVEQNGRGFPVYVSLVGRSNRKIFDCKTNEVVTSLIDRIRNEFRVESEKDILLYERVEIPGTISKPLPYDAIIDKYLKKDFVFDIEGRKPNFGNLEEYCCQQNIALVGSPSHGKSSTINTISKAVRQFAGIPIAQTYQEAKSGTLSYTKHEIHVDKSSFFLWDVPGKALKTAKSGAREKLLQEIFQGKLKTDKEIGTSTRRISRHHRKVHTLVIIQDGRAQIDQMHATALKTAKQKGRGIPVFILITKLDKMKEHELTAVKEKLSDSLGIDQSVMFGIANFEGGGSSQLEDPQKEEYIFMMLQQILAASKIHKDMLGKAGPCEYQ